MHVLANNLTMPATLVVTGEQITLQPGQRLLTCAAPPAVTGLACSPLPVLPLARILAFCDHAHGRDRLGPPRPVCVITDAAVDEPDVARQWLITQLARDADAVTSAPLQALLRQLARTECYGLVRFVLAHGRQETVARLASRYGLSVAHFSRRCREALGGPLKRELRRQRAAHALLEYPGSAQTFTHLAADHGYASLSHFCTDIKALIGRSPQSVYRAVARHSE